MNQPPHQPLCLPEHRLKQLIILEPNLPKLLEDQDQFQQTRQLQKAN